jgi:hypothetical protein
MLRLTALILSLCIAGPAAGRTIEEDVQYYIGMLGNPSSRTQATEFEALSGMGLSDPRLFDEVEKRLLADCEYVRENREERARVAWYFRALGFSGDEKYLPTLSRFTEDRTYRNYSIAAQRDLPQYTKWNPVISDRSKFDPKLADDSNRILNMLRSEDHRLQRVGAKRTFLTHEKDPAVVAMLAEKLTASYPSAKDDESLETAGWLLNALDRGSDGTHPLIREIAADQTVHYKLSARAKSLLQRRR